MPTAYADRFDVSYERKSRIAPYPHPTRPPTVALTLHHKHSPNYPRSPSRQEPSLGWAVQPEPEPDAAFLRPVSIFYIPEGALGGSRSEALEALTSVHSPWPSQRLVALELALFPSPKAADAFR